MCGMGRSFVGLPGWVAVLVCGMGRGPVLGLFVGLFSVRDWAVCCQDQGCRSASMCGIGRADLAANFICAEWGGWRDCSMCGQTIVTAYGTCGYRFS